MKAGGVCASALISNRLVMMKRILLYSIFSIVCILSCGTENVPQISDGENTQIYSLTVSLPEMKVRTTIGHNGEGYSVFWQDGDVISAGAGNVSQPLVDVSDNAGTAVFSFTKPVSDGDFVRYPGVETPSVLSVPVRQFSDNGQYDPDAAPLWGTVKMSGGSAPSASLFMNNVMAMLRFAIKGTAALSRVTIETVAGEPLNGTFEISDKGVVSGGGTTSSRTEVVFTSPVQLSSSTATALYIPVLPANYSKGFIFKLYDSEGQMMKTTFFGDGQQLSASNLAEFDVLYEGGSVEVLAATRLLGQESAGELSSENAAYAKPFAEGTVKYDDGQPAVGIKISDGFTVAVTDENGFYHFETAGKDVRYIYLSYPSDAMIEKTSAGCPAFFKPYSTDNYIYDFILRRQAVENEFVMFALSDAQAHHQTRSTQLTADVDRFLNESVPAINREIEKQTLPCYGVHLGDIIYSEGNRDSSPALTIMRSHMSKINMPVFQVMGNHDYTFFRNNQSVAPTETSSTINLLSQRSFESVFGPVNYSFDRGQVHFVVMKDVCYKCVDEWMWDDYDGGFTDEECEWLSQDLNNTSKDMMVVLCVHIPISSSSRGNNVAKVVELLKTFSNGMIFSGDAHYQRGVEDSAGTGFFEKTHATLCGQWWWSKIQGDGCPNGYTVYTFNGTDVEDSYFIGVNEGMNTRDYQMRIYKGNIRTGGRYAYFQLPYSENDYLINVFNGDPRWKVSVYEEGTLKGEAELMSRSYGDSFDSVTAGQTYNVADNSTKDWWATGYHIGVCQRGTTVTSYYTANYHMWKWTASGPDVKIKVEAVDPYGNVYTCEDVVTDGLDYPDYIKIPLSIF